MFIYRTLLVIKLVLLIVLNIGHEKKNKAKFIFIEEFTACKSVAVNWDVT